MKKITTISLCLLGFGVLTTSAQSKKELLAKVSELETQLKKTQLDLSVSREKENLLNQKIELTSSEVQEAREENTKLLNTINNFNSMSKQRVQNLEISLATIKQKDAQLKVVNDELSKAKEEKIKQLNIFKDALGTIGKVGFQNGMLTIIIPNSDLYKEGKSIELTEKGKAAVKKITEVLRKYPEYSIIIEGNSNELEFAKGKLPRDNWDLSGLQAASITRQLVKDSINPKRVVPIAKSKFNTEAVETVTRIQVKSNHTVFFNTIMEAMEK